MDEIQDHDSDLKKLCTKLKVRYKRYPNCFARARSKSKKSRRRPLYVDNYLVVEDVSTSTLSSSGSFTLDSDTSDSDKPKKLLPLKKSHPQKKTSTEEKSSGQESAGLDQPSTSKGLPPRRRTKSEKKFQAPTRSSPRIMSLKEKKFAAKKSVAKKSASRKTAQPRSPQQSATPPSSSSPEKLAATKSPVSEDNDEDINIGLDFGQLLAEQQMRKGRNRIFYGNEGETYYYDIDESSPEEEFHLHSEDPSFSIESPPLEKSFGEVPSEDIMVSVVTDEVINDPPPVPTENLGPEHQEPGNVDSPFVDEEFLPSTSKKKDEVSEANLSLSTILSFTSSINLSRSPSLSCSDDSHSCVRPKIVIKTLQDSSKFGDFHIECTCGLKFKNSIGFRDHKEKGCKYKHAENIVNRS